MGSIGILVDTGRSEQVCSCGAVMYDVVCQRYMGGWETVRMEQTAAVLEAGYGSVRMEQMAAVLEHSTAAISLIFHT